MFLMVSRVGLQARRGRVEAVHGPPPGAGSGGLGPEQGVAAQRGEREEEGGSLHLLWTGSAFHVLVRQRCFGAEGLDLSTRYFWSRPLR